MNFVFVVVAMFVMNLNDFFLVFDMFVMNLNEFVVVYIVALFIMKGLMFVMKVNDCFCLELT